MVGHHMPLTVVVLANPVALRGIGNRVEDSHHQVHKCALEILVYTLYAWKGEDAIGIFPDLDGLSVSVHIFSN